MLSDFLDDNDNFNTDGYVANPMLHLGGQRDVETHSRPSNFGCRRLSPSALEDLYAHVPMCQRVCNYIPGEIARAGWEVQLVGEESEETLKEFKKKLPAYMRRSKIKRMIVEAMTWASIYNRGSGILLHVEDGRQPYQPVDIGAIKSVKPVYVLDAEYLTPVRTGSAVGGIAYFTASVVGEFAELDQDDPRRIEAERMSRNGLDKVHPDRVMWFDGVKNPPGVQARYDGSIGRLQMFWNSFQRLEGAYQAMVNTLHRQQTLMLGRQGLMETLAATGSDANKAQLKQQLEVVFSQLNNLGMGLYDLKREKFEILKRDVGSFPAAIDLLKGDVITASGLTEMALFGTTKVGSGLSGADLRDRLDMAQKVSNRAEMELREPLEQFLEYAMAADDGPTGGEVPEDWVLKFKSSLVLTPQEEGALASQWAQTDAAYAQMVPGLGEALVRSRFGGGEWSSETQLPDPLPKAPAGPPVPGGAPAPEAPVEGGQEETPAGESEGFDVEQAAKEFGEEVLG